MERVSKLASGLFGFPCLSYFYGTATNLVLGLVLLECRDRWTASDENKFKLLD
jgi:hypothetical protein